MRGTYIYNMHTKAQIRRFFVTGRLFFGLGDGFETKHRFSFSSGYVFPLCFFRAGIVAGKDVSRFFESGGVADSGGLHGGVGNTSAKRRHRVGAVSCPAAGKRIFHGCLLRKRGPAICFHDRKSSKGKKCAGKFILGR